MPCGGEARGVATCKLHKVAVTRSTNPNPTQDRASQTHTCMHLACRLTDFKDGAAAQGALAAPTLGSRAGTEPAALLIVLESSGNVSHEFPLRVQLCRLAGKLLARRPRRRSATGQGDVVEKLRVHRHRRVTT